MLKIIQVVQQTQEMEVLKVEVIHQIKWQTIWIF